MIALYGHPFSSYTWKALIALYASDLAFEFRMVDPDHPDNAATVAAASPLGKFPLLVDGETRVFEATEEAVLNSLFKAETMESNGARIEALPVERVMDLYRGARGRR